MYSFPAFQLCAGPLQHLRVGKEARGGDAPDAEVPRVEVELIPQLTPILSAKMSTVEGRRGTNTEDDVHDDLGEGGPRCRGRESRGFVGVRAPGTWLLPLSCHRARHVRRHGATASLYTVPPTRSSDGSTKDNRLQRSGATPMRSSVEAMVDPWRLQTRQ